MSVEGWRVHRLVHAGERRRNVMARPADSKSGDRQPHAARRSPRQGATADHLTRSEHSSFRAAYGFPRQSDPNAFH